MYGGEVHVFVWVLPRRVCMARSFWYTRRAVPARWKLFFTSAMQQLRGSGIYFFRRAEPARQPTSPAGTVQTLRGGRMLEFCRADPIMKFVF